MLKSGKVFKQKDFRSMSAIKMGLPIDIHTATKSMQHPWDFIIQNIETLSPEQILEHACTASHLNVSGVFYGQKQHTFECFAAKINETSSNVLKALYGLSITMATGVVHPYLQEHTRANWVLRLFDVKIHRSPAFVFACRQQYQTVVMWMVDIMNDLKDYAPIRQIDCDGNSPLHIAVLHRRWEWTKQLVEHGCSPFVKNVAGKTPIMLAAPCYEHLTIFKSETVEWFDALHEALIDGKKNAMWCQSLIDAGADFNQSELYGSPLDTLLVLAHAGMDMNMRFDGVLSTEQHRIMYMYGKIDNNFDAILTAFKEDDWVRMLHQISHGHYLLAFPEYCELVSSRRAITKMTLQLQENLL
jgi:hypothetical protein